MKIKAFLLLIALSGALAAASVKVYTDPCLITKGKDCTIFWSVSGASADKVNITIWRGGTLAQQFLNVPNAPGENQKVWPVPLSLASGEYTFRVATTDNLAQGEYKGNIKNKGIYTDPNTPSGILTIGTPISFHWESFGLLQTPGVYFDLYRSGVLVGCIGWGYLSSLTPCGRTYTWIVGDLKDPQDPEGGDPLEEKAPAGSGYKIRIRNSDGSFTAETGTFAIAGNINPSRFKDRFRRISRIPVFPGPGCPMCGEVQLSDLLEIIQSEPGAHVVELWHAGRALGKLFEAGAAGRRSASRRIDFGNSFQQLKQGGSGFELRIFDNRGKLLHTQAVVLNFKSR